MSESAIDRTCDKYGCAKVYLDPKLHRFDHCFDGRIRMGDIDGAVERNGHILWAEFKRGAVLTAFERTHMAQVIQARAFTRNSPLQTFVFVLCDPVTMEVQTFRALRHGEWHSDWSKGGTERFELFLKRWFASANAAAANIA